MKIGLIDVDGHNFPNLALMKLSAWHKAQGDAVDWWNGFEQYDRVYMAKVFDATYSPDIPVPYNAADVIKGGTGYGLDNTLPESVERMCPDYSLYPRQTKDTAYGFLTRGCPRGCAFCIVGAKEGLRSRKVADLSQFWNGQKVIKLLDPNLLACAEHRDDLLGQLAESRASVDFTQGVDARLLTPELCKQIASIRTSIIHFAWDDPDDAITPEKIAMFKQLTEWRARKVACYVLTNFGSTHEQDLFRINKLREIGVEPYVMIYDKPHAPKITRDLQGWCNNRKIYKTTPRFEDYDPTHRGKEEQEHD